MKILYLNTWNGTQRNEYISFLEKHASEYDVLCLQEVSDLKTHAISAKGAVLNGWDLTKKALPLHIGYHAIRQTHWDDMPEFGAHYPAPWGLGLLIKNSLPILEYKELFLLGYHDSAKDTVNGKDIPVVLQAVKIMGETNPVWILNIHGHYAGTGVGKHDTEERILQSKKIVAFIETCNGSIVLGGDFNLNTDTESIRILEEAGLRNLITEYKIQGTRTSLYPEEKRVRFPHADYVFVSKDIVVEEFVVDTSSEVSDHAPMFVSCTV